MNRSYVYGDMALVVVALLWGVTFPVIENAVKFVNPFVFVTTRFFIAALVLLPFILKSLKKAQHKTLLGPGIVLGVLNLIAYNAQTMGLETVRAAQGAFITGTYVVMVPFLLPLFRMGSFRPLDLVSSFFCLIGLCFLTGMDLEHMNIGCLWILLCALATAVSIVYIQKVSAGIKDRSLLAFYQIFLTSLFSFPFSWGESYTNLFYKDALIALIFCGVFATTICLLLQAKYQSYTTASRAAMIFCLEPVFAAVFGYMINGEIIKPEALFGGALIIFSILIPEIYRLRRAKQAIS